ncbi:MAG TPA: hypothetical protein VEV40_01190 [Alloacidobacterium sp.]|nr:hypothetical protein [Alloacidobacterium sp.]HYK34543.1 hypothetical protein [Alloacidobacterium sp.]
MGIHQIKTEDNSLTITTSSGVLLVSKGQTFSLSTSVSGGVTRISDDQGNDITVILAGGGGQLGGILTVRDQDIPQLQSSGYAGLRSGHGGEQPECARLGRERRCRRPCI